MKITLKKSIVYLLFAIVLICLMVLSATRTSAANKYQVITKATATITTPFFVGEDASGITVTAPADANYTVKITRIFLAESPYTDVTASTPFAKGKRYAFRVSFDSKDDYVFDENTIYEINGEKTATVSLFRPAGNVQQILLTPSAEYTLTFSINEGKSISSDVTGAAHRYYDGNTLSIREGTKVWFRPVSGTDYNFVSASISGVEITKTGSQYYFTMPNKDITLTASFEPKEFDLTFDPNGGGGTAYTEKGKRWVTLPTTTTFTAPTGKRFAGWSETADGEIITQVEMTRAKTVYAIWEKLPTYVTFDANGGTCSSTYYVTNSEGKLTSLPTATREAHKFLGWFTQKTGGTKITTDTVFDEHTTVYAQWEGPPALQNASISTEGHLTWDSGFPSYTSCYVTIDGEKYWVPRRNISLTAVAAMNGVSWQKGETKSITLQISYRDTPYSQAWTGSYTSKDDPGVVSVYNTETFSYVLDAPTKSTFHTIKLMADLGSPYSMTGLPTDILKDYTVDLNGHTITIEYYNNGKFQFYVYRSAKIRFTDSSTEKTGKILAEKGRNVFDFFTFEDGATFELILDGITVTSTQPDNDYATVTNSASKKGHVKLTISDCRFVNVPCVVSSIIDEIEISNTVISANAISSSRITYSTNEKTFAQILGKDQKVAVVNQTRKTIQTEPELTALAGSVDARMKGDVQDAYIIRIYKPSIVTFDANGGTCETATATANALGKLASLPTATRNDYKFLGWFTQKTGGEKVTANTTFSANTTVYAQWQELPALSNVKLSADGTLTCDAFAGAAKYRVTLNNYPAYNTEGNMPLDYIAKLIFDDHGPGKTYEVTFCALNSEGYAISKIWTGTYTVPSPTPIVTFDASGGTCETVTAAVGDNGKLASLPNAKRNDYKFLGWFTQKTGGTKITTDTTFSANTTVYAQWQELPALSNVKLSADGTISWNAFAGAYGYWIKLDNGTDCVSAVEEDETSLKIKDWAYAFGLDYDSGITYTIEIYAEGAINGDLVPLSKIWTGTYTVPAHTHRWSTAWVGNSSYHWKECTASDCPIMDYSDNWGYAAHSGGTATCTSQAICSVCGIKYGYYAAHSYSTDWKTNGTHHWHECSCGAKKDETAHKFNQKFDEAKHWQECSCGYKKDSAAHSPNGEGKCTQCKFGHAMPGDLDDSGKVEAKDLVLMRRHIAKLEVTINKEAADINGDGKVNASDLVLLRRIIAGL